MTPVQELEAKDLDQRTDASGFSFETTEELDDLEQVIGQPRAVEAMKFGMGIEASGYNIFAVGPPGTGKRSIVTQY
ncbi:MAG: hypothetical protein ACP5JJ_10385, partial [Anaerolineae bacterium]